MNLKTLLQKSILELRKTGLKTPDLDAKVLLEHALLKDLAFIYSHPESLITNTQYARFRRYIQRRKTGEPVAYILCHKEFFGHIFIVNKNVLVPRPESEWLVEKSIALLLNLESRILKQEKKQINVIDVGTGSGCIIISIIKKIQDSRLKIQDSNFFASDLSRRAIEVGKKNSRLHKVDKIVKFYHSDLFSSPKIKNKIYDLVIANLPYVPQEKVRNSKFEIRNIKDGIYFEPENAIFAGNNGTEIIKKFLLEVKTRINPEGLILMELDPRNANDLLKFARVHYPTAKASLQKDLAGLNRYLIIKN